MPFVAMVLLATMSKLSFTAMHDLALDCQHRCKAIISLRLDELFERIL
jgi:hypothetical protein